MDNGKHLIQNRGDDKQKAFYHFSQEYIAVHKENKKKNTANLEIQDRLRPEETLIIYL